MAGHAVGTGNLVRGRQFLPGSAPGAHRPASPYVFSSAVVSVISSMVFSAVAEAL
jgi:hypothetical protein